MILIDTDILIDFSHADEASAALIASTESTDTLAVSTITVLEFLQGARDKREWQSCARTLLRFKHITLTGETSLLAPQLFGKYRLSHNLALADCLIAATAITLGIPLLTKNQRDFRFINDLQLLPYPPTP